MALKGTSTILQNNAIKRDACRVPRILLGAPKQWPSANQSMPSSNATQINEADFPHPHKSNSTPSELCSHRRAPIKQGPCLLQHHSQSLEEGIDGALGYIANLAHPTGRKAAYVQGQKGIKSELRIDIPRRGPFAAKPRAFNTQARSKMTSTPMAIIVPAAMRAV